MFYYKVKVYQVSLEIFDKFAERCGVEKSLAKIAKLDYTQNYTYASTRSYEPGEYVVVPFGEASPLMIARVERSVDLTSEDIDQLPWAMKSIHSGLNETIN